MLLAINGRAICWTPSRRLEQHPSTLAVHETDECSGIGLHGACAVHVPMVNHWSMLPVLALLLESGRAHPGLHHSTNSNLR